MSKELPYFKFNAAEWLQGDITLESFKTQGIFINICAYYWSKRGQIDSKTLQKRFKTCKKTIETLIKNNFLSVDHESEMISISFLDEQLSERKVLSDKNKANARKRWGAMPNECDRNATASVSHSQNNAIKNKKENKNKRREETSVNSKKSEDDFSGDVLLCFQECCLHFPKHLIPKNVIPWLDTIEKLNRIDGIPFEKIVEITKAARQDDFWSKNFLSLPKLRKKDKNGVPYVVVFNERFNNQTNKSSSKHEWLSPLDSVFAEVIERQGGQNG